MVVGAASVLTVACQKENLTNGNNLVSAETSNQAVLAGGGSLPRPKTLTLVKNGSDSIFYLADGRLAKVKHSNFSYTQYNYGFNTIIAKTYGGNKVDNEATYQIDIATGRVFESQHTGYSYYSGGTVVVTKTYKYVYDASGKLTKRYNKSALNERSEFMYNASNQLQNVFWYNSSNQHSQTLSLSYNNWNKGELADKLKLNSNQSGLDPYLHIFGTFSKSIITGQQLFAPQNITPFWGENYVYTLNADGYPVQYDRLHWLTSAYIGTVILGYTVK